MKKLSLSGLLVCMLILSSSQEKELDGEGYLADYNRAEKLFRTAEQLNTRVDLDDRMQKRQDQLYRDALHIFYTVEKKTGGNTNDSIRFHTFIRIGLINHYFDSVATAKEYYLAAIHLEPKITHVQDSFSFKPYLFLGGILYDEHKFDSAFVCYQQAESIQNSYRIPLDGSQRLYNRLGAMYYETGNYRLARNYFEKALSSLSFSQPSYTSLMINYKINIAAILIKLQEYDEAKKIYQDLLPYKIYENEIWHNLGIIDNHQGKFSEAISNFKKVKYPSGGKNIDLDYNLAIAFNNLGRDDSVNAYLQKAISENRRVYGNQKNTAWGLVLKFLGDKKNEEGDYGAALHNFQQAILQFDISFHDSNIYKDPDQFTGFFSYINLFNALTAKAETFKKLYTVDKDAKELEAALQAYQSAFKLVDYVEKTYESDEARLFLQQIAYSEHNKPIDLSLELYQLTKEKKYLEEAYFLDQQNKASILSLNLQVHQMQMQGGKPSGLINKENYLRTSITRLSLNAAQISDTAELHKITETINDLQIELASVQEVLNRNPKYSQLQLSNQIPAIHVLQSKILDDNTALLSYHLSGQEIVIFVITKDGFNYCKLAINPNFYERLRAYLKYLHGVSGEGESDNGNSKALYAVLIKPIVVLVGTRKRLIIIPDDELNYLPFEALRDASDNYLIKLFSVQYQYSTAILNFGSKDKTFLNGGNLSFAPFSGGSSQNGLETLPYSKNEVEAIGGRVLIGKDATKRNFLSLANHYGIIHLATHAKVNDSVPAQSFISFFPDGKVSASHLYASEIYDLQLDSIQLVILTACETGAGELVRGEGLMSLSRAFSYAGCPNIITSLWKAEDKTTAFIAQRLHYYLQRKMTYDEALRRAKLDLLNSDEIGPRFKTPNYWAHLIFIGDYKSAKSSSSHWPWILDLILIIIGVFLFVMKKSRARRDSILHRT